MRRGAVSGTDVKLKNHPPSTPHMHGSAPHTCSPPQDVHLVHLVCVSCAKAPRRHIYHTQNPFLKCSALNQEPFSSHVWNKCRISLNPICFERFYCWDCCWETGVIPAMWKRLHRPHKTPSLFGSQPDLPRLLVKQMCTLSSTSFMPSLFARRDQDHVRRIHPDVRASWEERNGRQGHCDFYGGWEDESSCGKAAAQGTLKEMAAGLFHFYELTTCPIRQSGALMMQI